ncbi:MAG: BglII/BstYI family type II restriction endonuclease [Vulcanimicrobiaceae bacterium]
MTDAAMMGAAGDLVPPDIAASYEVHEWRNAVTVLQHAYPKEWADVLAVLRGFRLSKSFIQVGGGNKSKVSAAIDAALYARGWEERKFDAAVVVDEQTYPSPTHSVDCYKNKIALEIEWNNKDPFFDRDLNNFRLLFELRVVSVGIIVTRCDELQEIFHSLGRGSSYGMSTTHMSKLLPKIEGGGAGGCPVILFGIRASLYDPTS